MRRSEMTEMQYALVKLTMAIDRLSEKVDSCQGMCEAVLDEVVPIGQVLDALAEVPQTAD